MGRQQDTWQPADFVSSGIFRGLTKNEIDIVRSLAIERTFKPAEVMINPEQPALHFFLLEEGCADYFVLTHNGREILLRRMVPGDTFGVAAFLPEPTGYMGTARTTCELTALIWERKVIRQLGRRFPPLLDNALHIALGYVALYAKRHVALVMDSAQERVAYVLTELGSRTGHTRSSGVEVKVRNEDLASLADVSFFTVSRLMKAWDRNGAVKKTRGKVLICRPEDLLAEK